MSSRRENQLGGVKTSQCAVGFADPGFTIAEAGRRILWRVDKRMGKRSIVGVVSIPIYICAELFHPNRFMDVEECDRLLVIGTTLATYSAFRIVKHAIELNKPVFVLNMGPTRADGLPGIQKVDGLSGSVLSEVVRTIL
jgi:hypothetical protein